MSRPAPEPLNPSPRRPAPAVHVSAAKPAKKAAAKPVKKAAEDEPAPGEDDV